MDDDDVFGKHSLRSSLYMVGRVSGEAQRYVYEYERQINSFFFFGLLGSDRPCSSCHLPSFNIASSTYRNLCLELFDFRNEALFDWSLMVIYQNWLRMVLVFDGVFFILEIELKWMNQYVSLR